MSPFPDAWKRFLGAGVMPLLVRVEAQLESLGNGEVLPPKALRFRAFELTPPEATRVVILGQDPYHGEGEANGLAFSISEGKDLPSSLRNIFEELATDFGGGFRTATDLGDWAEQGVLLLNTVLTVEKDRAGSHRGLGWEPVTRLVIDTLERRETPCVFVLWGDDAKEIGRNVDRARHLVLESPHPSPLAAYRGFWGSKPFSQVNRWLVSQGQAPIRWSKV